MILKNDCRHFPGSRPCRYNKQSKMMCSDCMHYAPQGIRILIIKLDAIGDVLRTTALLPSLKNKYADSYIVWVTKSNAEELFRNNMYVDEVWTLEKDACTRLRVEAFDMAINTDADKLTCALASLANAKVRYGMILNEKGVVCPVNDDAIEWLEMGAFDQVKQRNKKTYQQIIHEICGITYNRQKPVLCLTKRELEWAIHYFEVQGVKADERVIGINLGGGGRWKRKIWSLDHIKSFSKKILNNDNCRLLIIGGKQEELLMKELSRHLSYKTSYTGTNLSLRELASLVAHCSAVITGDSLVLHMATALDIPVVALFGPTSAAEIELYDRGDKLVSENCNTCYLTECDKKPTCMDQISPNVVMDSLYRVLNIDTT